MTPSPGTPPPLSAPPTPPEIAGQQGPVSSYAANFNGGGASAIQQSPLLLVQGKLQEIAVNLRDVAKVLSMSKPGLLPVLQKMVEAGSMLMDEVQKTLPQIPGGGPDAGGGVPETPGSAGAPGEGGSPPSI